MVRNSDITVYITTLRIRLNQSDPCEPILGGRWQVILVVEGS